MCKQSFLERERKIPVIANSDVLVAGGGVAGIAAALSAAGNGAKTILLERYGFLGGTVTSCPMSWIGGYNEEVHSGIIREMIFRLRQKGGITREFYNPVIGGLMLEVSLDTFKEVSVLMLHEAGVELLLHCWIADSIVEDGSVKGVIIESKSGRQAISSGVTIDATGDGDVVARAGAAFEKGRPDDGKMQAMTLCGPTMDNVDVSVLLEFVREYRRRHPEEIREFIDGDPVFAVSGFTGMIEGAKREGNLGLLYDTIWINGKKGSNMVDLSGSFVPDADGTSMSDLTLAEAESLTQLSCMVDFARRYIPGFNGSRRLDRGSAAIGVRETRRLVGEYMLTEEDIVAGRKFDDVVARNSTPMDVHNPEGNQSWTEVKPYDIPYRCLVPQDINGLIAAGRCISATHRALASVRFIPCCMGTGEAAGLAAALATRSDIYPRQVDISELQDTLRDQGVSI
ncbi:MAG: FAD-dependent oxidoreductase [bacterium]